MKIKNYELKEFGNFLLSEKLVGRKSRFRTRFIKLADAQLNLINDERLELLKEFSDKEDGNPIIENVDNVTTYKMSDENKAKFVEEYNSLMNEDFTIDETDERKEMLLIVKDIVLDSGQSFSGVEAMQYDRWCDIVDEIDYPEA